MNETYDVYCFAEKMLGVLIRQKTQKSPYVNNLESLVNFAVSFLRESFLLHIRREVYLL